MPDKQHAIDFLATLTAGTPKDPARYFYLWDKPNNKKTASYAIQDPTSIAAATSWTETPSDLYVAVGAGTEPVGRHTRMKNNQAAGLYGVYLDVDLADEVLKKQNCPPSLDAAMDLIDEFGAPPTMLVFSGHGLQPWWLFKKPWLFDTDEERAAAASLSLHWVKAHQGVAKSHGWELDSVQELARLMRLPGTINAKVPDEPVGVVLIDATGPRYELAELEELIARHPVDGPVVVNMAAAAPTTRDVEASFTVDAQASPPEDKLAALLSRPTAAASWNHAREDLADQSPSSYDLSLASMAVAAGWDDQDIVDLLIACRRHNQSPPKLRTDYLVRTLAKARSSPEPGNGDGDDGDDTLGKHIKQHGLIPVLADLLEDDTHFAGDDGGGLYRFTGGRYEPAHRWLGREARQQLEDGMATKHWRASAGKDLAHYIWLVAPRLWDQPPADVLNVQNGLLDIASGRLREHDPRHLSTVQLPVRYDPDATCPHIDQFVRDTFPEDAFDLAAQMIAFVMLPDPSIQKAILLIGSGGNGKSVWLRVVQRFLGSENYSTESLQRLEGNRFAVSSLQGKLANICADLPATDLKGSSVFKSVTGNDRLIAERKYHDAYDLSPYCKLIFSANNPPRTPDASEAFFQRWLVINFSRTFRGEAIEVSSRELDARLHDPVELSGLLNRALAALPRLRANGFSEPLSCLMARDAFRAATDPVSVWIDQSTRSVPGAYITKAQLLEEYNAAAITSGNPTMTANAFGRSLRHNRPNLRSGQRRLADRMTDVWLDVTLRTDQTAHSGDSGNHTTGMNWGS